MPVPQYLPYNIPVYTPNASYPVKNNGGSIYFGGGSGTLQNNRLFDGLFGSLSLPYTAYRSGQSEAGPKYISDENIGTYLPFAGGNFGTMVAGQYVLLTFTSQLAGVANTTLRFAATANRKSNNLFIGWIDTALYNTTGGFYVINGQPVNLQASRDQVNTEKSGNASPGRLSYQIGSDTVKTQSYAAKTD